jgi:hypothetical protein
MGLLINRIFRFLILIAAALLGWTANAQILKINARFDSTSILIGDQVKLRIEVDQPKDAKVHFPVFADTLASKIKVVKVFPPDTVPKNGNLHIQQDVLVTSFDSGYHYVAPLVFPFEMGTVKDSIRSAQLYLIVLTVPMGNAKDINDIKPPYNASFTIAEILLYILIGVGVIILAFVTWFLVKKFRKEPIFTIRKPVEPAHIVALRELDKLRTEKLWQQNKGKEYYTRLTEIIRVYIEQRYEIIALELTSDEIIQALRNVMVEDINSIDLLRKMFVTADLVKFAKLQTLPDENEINLLNAYQFVNNTKLVETVINSTIEESKKVDIDASRHKARSNFRLRVII